VGRLVTVTEEVLVAHHQVEGDPHATVGVLGAGDR
jgi:hypothetical protein